MNNSSPANHRTVTSLVVFHHFARVNSNRFDRYLLAYSGTLPVGFWFIAPNFVCIPDSLCKPSKSAPVVVIKGGQTIQEYLNRRIGAGIDFYSWQPANCDGAALDT